MHDLLNKLIRNHKKIIRQTEKNATNINNYKEGRKEGRKEWMNEWMNEWMCIYIPHISHIVSRRFKILNRDLKIWGRHPSRTPPEVRFRIKRSLRMSVREWDGVSHVVSTPFFSFRVVNKTWVCFCFWSSNYPFLSPFSLSFCIIYC